MSSQMSTQTSTQTPTQASPQTPPQTSTLKSIKLKVPTIMQMEALECGAASLAMVLAFFGKWVPLSEVREKLGVSRDGVTMKSIQDGAKFYGLNCKAMRMFPKSFPQKATLPCIAFWDFKHFVVVTGYTKKFVFINNPSCGKERYTWDEFKEHFSCVALIFEKTEDFVADGKQASVLSFVKNRLIGAKGVILFVALAGLLGACIGVLSPKVSQAFIDQVLGNENTQLTGPLLIVLTAVALLQLILGALQTSYLNTATGHYDVKTSREFTAKLLKLPMRFYSQRSAGDLMSRQTANTQVSGTLLQTVAPLLVNVVSLVIYAVAMFSISAPLAFIGVGTTIVNVFVAWYISTRRIEIFRVIARDSGLLSGVTSGIIDSIETAKASGFEKHYFVMWAGEQSALVAGQARASKLNMYLGSVPGLLFSLANAFIIIVGVMLIMQGHLTAGGLVAIQSFVSLFLGPAQEIVNSNQTIQEMRTNMERIEDVMENPDDVVFLQNEAEQIERPLSGKIEIQNLTFGYSTQSKPLLSDFSLTLEQGKSVALVGGSGSGKSTVARLIAGLYQPWSGTILYDGLPFLAINRKSFTRSLAVVDQDISLLGDTVEEVLAFGNPDASEQDIVQAAKDALIHEVIATREEGYQRKVHNGAKDYSGGQRQQLEIARALAGNPRILILDEATSALDAQTEKEVIEAIKARGISLVFVAHRLSTIRDADEIVVLEHGVVVERGTHESLMARKGAYYELICAND